MLRKFYISALLGIVLSSSLVAQSPKSISANAKATTKEKKPLYKWVGMLDKKRLSIVIDSISRKKGYSELYGYNIAGKTRRPLKGTAGKYNEIVKFGFGEEFDIILKEPGDDKWDGVFVLKQMSTPGSEGMYEFFWKPYNSKILKDAELKVGELKEIITPKGNPALY